MSPESPHPQEEPVRLFTHGAQREHFEQFRKDYQPELIDEDYDQVRAEIGDYYQVPPENRFFIEDEKLEKKKRTQRAFSVVILDSGERYFIDGRTAHAVLMRVLKNTHHVNFDPEIDPDEANYASVHGFIDPHGFEDVEMVQKKSKELNRPITWFVRYTVPSSSPSSSSPISPIEIA